MSSKAGMSSKKTAVIVLQDCEASCTEAGCGLLWIMTASMLSVAQFALICGITNHPASTAMPKSYTVGCKEMGVSSKITASCIIFWFSSLYFWFLNSSSALCASVFSLQLVSLTWANVSGAGFTQLLFYWSKKLSVIFCPDLWGSDLRPVML